MQHANLLQNRHNGVGVALIKRILCNSPVEMQVSMFNRIPPAESFHSKGHREMGVSRATSACINGKRHIQRYALNGVFILLYEPGTA